MLVAQGLELRFDPAMMVKILADLYLLAGNFLLGPGVAVLLVQRQPLHEAADDGQAGLPTHVLRAGHGAWWWLWLLVRKLQRVVDVRVLGVRVLMHLLDGPDRHAGIGYLSGGRTFLTRSREGAWPRDAAADTQASRQAKQCAHRGILIQQSVLGSLPL